MNFTPTDIKELRAVLAACKVLNIDGIVITDGLARGVRPAIDGAILSEIQLSDFSGRMGIGRVSELDKRLAIFDENVSADVKTNDAGDATLISISSGRSKMQFRCTSPNLIKYPKTNDDPPAFRVSLSKEEVTQFARAAKTLGSEHVTMQITRTGSVKLECADSASDKFNTELETAVSVLGDEQSAVFTYLATLFVDLLDAGAKSVEKDAQLELTIGESGSLTCDVKGRTLVIFPQINSNGDDDE